MPTLDTYTSAGGTHARAIASADDPAVFRNIRGGSTIAVVCDSNATAHIELSISAPSLPDPLWVKSAAGVNGSVPPGGTAIDEIQSKLAAIRVRVEGPGSAIVEVLQ